MSLLLILLFCFNSAISLPQQPVPRARSIQRSSLTGVYRIDIPASDKLYSVVAGASSKVPFSEQQRFFIDLAVRLTPPDLLAIEQRGTRVSLAFFAGSSAALQYSPIEVCRNFDAIQDNIAHMEWRMAWSGTSRLRQGAQSIAHLTRTLGESVLTRFVLPFELLGVLMLAAMLGAVYFARPED